MKIKSPPIDESAVYLLEDTVVAYPASASTLDQLCNARVDYEINESELESALRAEIHAGRMLIADKATRVELTGQTKGCLIEFRAGESDSLWYAFASRFEARRICQDCQNPAARAAGWADQKRRGVMG